MMRGGGVWETSFEDMFDIDDKVHAIVANLSSFEPPVSPNFLFFRLLEYVEPFNGLEAENVRRYKMDEEDQRDLLLLIYSLLIRSPGFRWRCERLPKVFGLPENEGVGTANIHNNFRSAKRLCKNKFFPLLHFVILRNRGRNFVAGDGYLDWLTGGLIADRVSGCALLPLTPSLCVYVRSLQSRGSEAPDCTAISVGSKVVDQINDLTQIYSGRKLFFKGKPPKLTEHFKNGEYLQHSNFIDPFIDKLDEKAGRKGTPNFLGLDTFS